MWKAWRRGEGLPGVHVRHPVGAGHHELPLVGDRELQPGNAERALAVAEPFAGPGRHVLDELSGDRHGESVPSRSARHGAVET